MPDLYFLISNFCVLFRFVLFLPLYTQFFLALNIFFKYCIVFVVLHFVKHVVTLFR